MTTTTTTTATWLDHAAATTVELSLGGMTCASCAARIEKRLNKLDGVEATVNYALERAAVTFEPTVSTDDLVAAVEAIGYRAAIVGDTPVSLGSEDVEEREQAMALHGLWMRLLISAMLTLPVFVLAMVPSLQFDSWQWLSLALWLVRWQVRRAAARTLRTPCTSMFITRLV